MSVADVDDPGAADVWTRCYAHSVTHSTNVCAIPVVCGKIYFSHGVRQLVMQYVLLYCTVM
jgi:hypothetical protein